MTNAEVLKKVYAQCLFECHKARPEEYLWPIEKFDEVMTRMSAAIDAMSFNKDSSAWRLCCKRLGIKHTYQAIKAFKESTGIGEVEAALYLIGGLSAEKNNEILAALRKAGV